MTQKSIDTKQQIDEDLPPSGVQKDDWANTPISVRKLYSILREVSIEDFEKTPRSVRKYLSPLFGINKEYKNRYPLITILINLGVIVFFTYILDGIVTIPCITPRIVSPLSLSILVLFFLHLALRPLARNPSSQNENIHVGKYTISLSIITAFLYEMQFWKLRSSLLVLLLIVSIFAGTILNFSSYSPFYTPDELSAIQGFIINRFHKDFKEGIPVGGTLTLTVNEMVHVQAKFLKESDRTCVWYSNMSNPTSHLGCSIVLDEVSKPGPDTLSVLIQSACGTQDFTGLHVEVLSPNQEGQK